MKKLKIIAIIISSLIVVFSVVSSVLMMIDWKGSELGLAGIGVFMLVEILFALAMGLVIWLIANIIEKRGRGEKL